MLGHQALPYFLVYMAETEHEEILHIWGRRGFHRGRW